VIDESSHSKNSTLRERIVEHIFVGEALRLLWNRNITDVEVLRSEFDAFGYDLVMTLGKIVRHIQLKSGTRKRPGKVSVARVLAEKPSGCVIWISLGPDLKIEQFHWFGSNPGSPLPTLGRYPNPKRATHNKAGERPARQNHHEIPASVFQPLADLDQVLLKLFGPRARAA
jgi:hypothetical protein